jgi:hypothetical protein
MVEFANDPGAALNVEAPSSDNVEEASKLLSEWLGYAWDGLGDRDISADWPDWTYGFSGRSLQGGKPAVRRIVSRVLEATAAAPDDGWRDMSTAPVRKLGSTEYAWFLGRVSPAHRSGRSPVIVVRSFMIDGRRFLRAAEAPQHVHLDFDVVDGWKPLPSV